MTGRPTARGPRPRRGGLVLVGEPAPWFAAPVSSPAERRRALEDEHSRLLARAVGDHLPFELAQRAAELEILLDTREVTGS